MFVFFLFSGPATRVCTSYLLSVSLPLAMCQSLRGVARPLRLCGKARRLGSRYPWDVNLIHPPAGRHVAVLFGYHDTVSKRESSGAWYLCAAASRVFDAAWLERPCQSL